MKWLTSLFGRGASAAQQPLVPPTDVFLGLRGKVFELSNDPGAIAGSGDGPLALLMETVHPPAVATLAAICDGTTSYYFSNGGGIIGSGQHPPVAAASKAWLARTGNEFASAMAPASEFPLPTAGQVRFYLVYAGRVLTGEASEDDLVRKRHPLWPIFHDAQLVIAQIRRHAPK
jgi:hypothetical protein